MQQINNQIRAFLATGPSDAALTDYINHMTPNVVPTLQWHRINPKALQEPTTVYVHLMVQDVQETFFYYSFIMKRPFTGQYFLYKFGSQAMETEDVLDDPKFLKVMTDRKLVMCTPISYSTQWTYQLQKQVNQSKSMAMFADDKVELGLGDVIHVVAMYNPANDKLYYVRKCREEEVREKHLDLVAELGVSAVNWEQTRPALLHFLSRFTSEKYAHFLLYMMLSDEPLFLSCNANISSLLSALYPRVCHLPVKHPFNHSFFPYKNEDGVLQQTAMQLSNQPTLVVLDFSHFSNEKETKIEHEQIDNLKALKIFVEEGKTIYRWEAGESIIDHKHSGLVVLASSIITPQIVLPLENAMIKEEELKNLPEEVMYSFRAYIQAARRVNPKLTETERPKIEEAIEALIKESKVSVAPLLQRRMQFARLSAKSKGKQEICFADYTEATRLLE